MKPEAVMNGCALWYSPMDGGYYWQDELGTGWKTSRIYKSKTAALVAMQDGKVRLKK